MSPDNMSPDKDIPEALPEEVITPAARKKPPKGKRMQEACRVSLSPISKKAFNGQKKEATPVRRKPHITANKDTRTPEEHLLEHNLRWDELPGMINQVRQEIGSLSHQCGEIFSSFTEKDEAEFSQPENRNAITRLSEVFSKDIVNVLDALDSIESDIGGRKGQITGIDEYTDFLTISQRVQIESQRFAGALTPLMAELANITSMEDNTSPQKEEIPSETEVEEPTRANE